VLLLSKWDCEFTEHDYQKTRMTRSLLVAKPKNNINGQKVIVATSHFESLDYAEKRES
jgi:hypothetical protein